MSEQEMKTRQRRGRLLLLAAALLWSTSGFFAKSPPMHDFPEEHRGSVLTFYRALFATVVLLPFMRRSSIRWRPALVPMSIIFAATNLLFLTAMTKTTAAAAIFLQYTSTVWAFLLGWLLLKERVSRGNLIALLCAIVGIVWIVVSNRAGQHASGNLIALGSGFSYACVVLFLRHLRDENSAWLIVVNHAVTTLLLLPWILMIDVELTPQQWGVLAAMGIFQMGIPYTLFAAGVRYVKVQEAALITLLEPILNPILVWICWGEVANSTTWIGGAFILGGLAIRYAFFSNDRTSSTGNSDT